VKAKAISDPTTAVAKPSLPAKIKPVADPIISTIPTKKAEYFNALRKT
jgi:hypothetical protein